MRGGKFLAEESPEFLLRQYHCDTLEDVFLKLSVMQNLGKRRRSSIVHEISVHVSVPAISVDYLADQLHINCTYLRILFYSLRTLLWTSQRRISVKFPGSLVTVAYQCRPVRSMPLAVICQHHRCRQRRNHHKPFLID